MPKSRPTRPRHNPRTLADLRLRAYREIPAGYDHDPSLSAASARAAALAGIARHRVIIDRDRHRARETKARDGFRYARRDITTRTARAEISVCGPLAA